MPKRVAIIGGYGNFGRFIANHLSNDPNIKLIIAGRSLEKAMSLCNDLKAVHPAQPYSLDIHADLTSALQIIKPDILIHTSGPFQGQDAFVAKACIDYGCHYIDLADGRDFVVNIAKLNSAAKNKKRLIISGASSVPALSSSIIDAYKNQFTDLTTVEYAITTAQKTNRGLATTKSVLSYAGTAFKTLINGNNKNIYGWQNIHKFSFKGLGNRYLGNCDIPDLDLFPKRYPSIKTLRFYAGLELPFLHIGLWGLSWLKRWGLLPSLDIFAAPLLKTSFLFDRFGSDASAFVMQLSGTDKHGHNKRITCHLTAYSGDGPYIPCMPAIILASKLANNQINKTGATACMGLISLDEYLAALKPLDIEWSTETTS